MAERSAAARIRPILLASVEHRAMGRAHRCNRALAFRRCRGVDLVRLAQRPAHPQADGEADLSANRRAAKALSVRRHPRALVLYLLASRRRGGAGADLYPTVRNQDLLFSNPQAAQGLAAAEQDALCGSLRRSRNPHGRYNHVTRRCSTGWGPPRPGPVRETARRPRRPRRGTLGQDRQRELPLSWRRTAQL